MRILIVATLSTLLILEGLSFPISTEETDSTPTPGTTVSPIDPNFDYNKEEQGFYTGPWEQNKFLTFVRTQGIIASCYMGSQTTKFIGYLADHPDMPLGWDYSTLCYKEVVYLRDYNSKQTDTIPNPRTFFAKSNDFANEMGTENTYPRNTDAVWMVNIPADMTALIYVMKMEIEDPTAGACNNDFFSIYTDQDTSPSKFCSTLDQFRVYKKGPAELTIRFKSNEANDIGGFSAGVYIVHSDSVFSRRRRESEDAFENSLEEGQSEVPAVVDENIPSDEKESSNILVSDEVLNCFGKIIKYGDSMAKKYIDSNMQNEECRKLAQEYLKNSFTSP